MRHMFGLKGGGWLTTRHRHIPPANLTETKRRTARKKRSTVCQSINMYGCGQKFIESKVYKVPKTIGPFDSIEPITVFQIVKLDIEAIVAMNRWRIKDGHTLGLR